MIAVWVIDLEEKRALRGDVMRTLSVAERARADRFRFDRDRERWLAGRLAQRMILARELGADLAEIEYATGVNGKPSLAGRHEGALEFNLSHSGSCGLLAFTRGVPLGVDVEEVHPIEDIRAIAERHFAPEEQERLFALPAAEQEEGFYRLWTRKEAYIKAIGTGLSHALDRFAVTHEPEHCRFVHLDGDAEAAASWSLLHLRVRTGFVGAVAVPRPLEATEMRPFSWSE